MGMPQECGVLFNSPEFLFVFLPVLLMGFYTLGSANPRWAAAWLTLGSLCFYTWWNPAYLWLLLGSIVFNFAVGSALAQGGDVGSARRRLWLVLGVAGNLALLGYFKYAHFFLESVGAALGVQYSLHAIVLPLGISFFTFTQIAFLADAASGKVSEPDFLLYALFVSYFPHLIAGPVLHHAEMMPQLAQPQTYRLQARFWASGLTVFALGLFKKTVLADGVAPYAVPAFAAAAAGQALGLLQAWGGALVYALQLYFDFSGYSDMAIGLSYLIGVRLPQNFASPYQATSIAEFWRRWHMSLSRFLRDYLYIPLGGNRKGSPRRYLYLMVTMVLGGLWHGAAWTFVLWGGLHGLALVLYQAWRALRLRLGHDPERSTWAGRGAATVLTFLLVVVGWVFFRSSTVPAAMAMLGAMCGQGGVSLPMGIGLQLGSAMPWLERWGVVFTPGGGREFVLMFGWVAALFPLVFWAPNSQTIMRRFQPALTSAGAGSGAEVRRRQLQWQPTTSWAVALALVLALGLLSLSRPAEFLYFQF